MKTKIRLFVLIMTALSVATLTSCHQNGTSENSDTAAAVADDQSMPPADGADTTACLEEEAETEAAPVPETQPQPTRKAVADPSYGGKETLYISTYGANGKVWGHVTMNGKTGRGTIHDDDENSYSITVTRHGGELYGTDQNGRQYVFRM